MIARLVLALMLCSLMACSATHTLVAKRDLEVRTKMSETIFLELVPVDKKTVFLQVKNTSQHQSFNMQPVIEEYLQRLGYTVVHDPEAATYLLRCNTLYIDVIDPTAAQKLIGTTGLGGLAGAAIGYQLNESSPVLGGAVGTIVGSLAETAANAMVKDVTYSVIVDIRISEKQYGASFAGYGYQHADDFNKPGGWRHYETQVVGLANQVNLKFEEARLDLEKALGESIGGIF